jgi:hypothetical protein
VISEVLITALVLLVILDVNTLASVVFFVFLAHFSTVLVVIVRLQAALRLEFIGLLRALGSEASAHLFHIIEKVVTAALLASTLRVIVIIEYLVFLHPLLL